MLSTPQQLRIRNEAIVKLFRIAETASRKEVRTTFKEMVGYVRRYAGKIDGLLFSKVDQAAGNLFDYVKRERLESFLEGLQLQLILLHEEQGSRLGGGRDLVREFSRDRRLRLHAADLRTRPIQGKPGP